jgi:hypothetical protein
MFPFIGFLLFSRKFGRVNMSLLEVKNLSKVYISEGVTTPVLKEVELSIYESLFRVG